MGTAGTVYLVGAGPGDPGLITARGREVLARAEVLVYDRLVAPELVALAPDACERVYVGKQPGRHTLTQAEINALLIERARAGRRVVRLKGGDPFVFGRGGEEAEALHAAGVPFEVVPGVTSAVAVPAYAGIPVTHRGHASSFAVITGQEGEARGEQPLEFARLAAAADTLVFLMGVERLPEIVAALQAGGRPPDMPTAVIAQGTLPEQRTVVGTLADIVERVRAAGIAPPAVTVVGEVVALRERLRWFDRRPLFGRRVLVTRTREQASQLVALLRAAGARPVELPTIAIRPPERYDELDTALGELAARAGRQPCWVLFTSANAVAAVRQRLAALGRDARLFAGATLGAIGPATAAALEALGLRPDYVPPTYTSAAILADLRDRLPRGAWVLLPRADIAPPGLAEGLAALGAEVRSVVAYRTVAPPELAEHARALLAAGAVDTACFTSSSTVRNLVAALGGDPTPLARLTIACIGPETAAAAAALGVRVDVVAREHTVPGLVAALVEHVARSDAAASAAAREKGGAP
ncbi:MAG TPA: uroporphyrinogen-III C-methyltransferase [Chloroflexota bacterium]|nr:uroporphyrinogen-III C-methyltransferase [Chloroflexota bacterium]